MARLLFPKFQFRTAGEQHLKTMAPKKSQTKQTSKNERCPYNNRGYCKSKDNCDKKHSDKVCEDSNCKEEFCENRHPNPCKFGIRCQFNKKNECMYMHDTLACGDKEINTLKAKFDSQIGKLKDSVVNMQKTLEEKDSDIKLLKEKFDALEKVVEGGQMNDIKKDLAEKNAMINGLEIKINELDKEHQKYRKQQEKKIKDLENTCKQKPKKEINHENKISEEKAIKCNKCDFSTTSRQGLKIHNSKTHSKINYEEFPAACDVCEKVLDNEISLKQHKKREHTYHSVRYQCNECEFMANDPLTLHVHFGVNHSPKNECGLCDQFFNNSKQLEDHLSQCESFVCDNSGCTNAFKNVAAIREHISEMHRKNSPAHYQFSYYIINAKDKSEKEVSKKYQTIYPKDW